MPARCEGQRIVAIDVRTEPPHLGGIFRRAPAIARLARDLHTTTRAPVVRRFLALKLGGTCSELRRAESERILRAQPFLSDAVVRVFEDVGGVRVVVTTEDELSLLVGLAARSPARPVALKLGNANFQGSGTYALVEWREGDFYRDTWGAKFLDYQFLGRPYQLEAVAQRRRLGQEWRAELSHPYFTDLQRVAWRLNGGEWRDYRGFIAPVGLPPKLETRRRWSDLGGIVRIGVPGRLSLFGASISREEEWTDEEPFFETDTGLVLAGGAIDELSGRYGRHRTARINALWGVRNVRFMRVRGFDAITGAQDVRVGMQFGTLFGRGLSVFGAEDDDMFVALDAYAGFGGPWSFAALEVLGEGRQNYDENRWDGVLTSGRGAWYLRMSPHHTQVTSLEMSGGWRQRVPFQLTMADFTGGVRGYSESRLAGGQRIVARTEHRWMIGMPWDASDLAIAGFADAGRLKAGDVPFGVDTPIQSSVGLGIMTAVPSGSRRAFRVDFVFPLSPGAERNFELRLSSTNAVRQFWREPDDVAVSRERSVPSNVFSWP